MRHILRHLTAPFALLPLLAHAAPIYFQNTTVITGSDGQAYSQVGAEFQTRNLTLSATRQNGANALTFSYLTAFDGYAEQDGVSTTYPDIFLRLPGSGYSAQPFTYAVALGDQTANGGLSAGLYAPSQVASSQAIWSARPAYLYGALYGETSGAGYAAPVVMQAGQLMGGMAVASATSDTGTQSAGQELYTLDVTVSGLSDSLAAVLNKGFDVFWGTGDCANGAFLASFQGGPLFMLIGEPGSFAVCLGGLVVLAFVRRKAVPY